MPLHFRPLSTHVGVEVLDHDLGAPISPSDSLALRQAFTTHDLLLVRQPDLPAQDQARFARVFGDIEIRNKTNTGDGISQHVSNTRPDGILGDGEIVFHQDHLFYPQPLMAIILYGMEIPASGSVTRFRSGSATFQKLSPEVQDMASRVECLHLYDYAADYSQRQRLSTATPGSPHAWQPLVWTQPETGRRTLWLSPLNVVGFRGVSEQDGEALLAEISRVAEQDDEATYSHSWAVGDLVLWSNVMLHHARMPFNASERRTLRRTPLVASAVA